MAHRRICARPRLGRALIIQVDEVAEALRQMADGGGHTIQVRPSVLRDLADHLVGAKRLSRVKILWSKPMERVTWGRCEFNMATATADLQTWCYAYMVGYLAPRHQVPAMIGGS